MERCYQFNNLLAKRRMINKIANAEISPSTNKLQSASSNYIIIIKAGKYNNGSFVYKCIYYIMWETIKAD